MRDEARADGAGARSSQRSAESVRALAEEKGVRVDIVGYLGSCHGRRRPPGAGARQPPLERRQVLPHGQHAERVGERRSGLGRSQRQGPRTRHPDFAPRADLRAFPAGRGLRLAPEGRHGPGSRDLQGDRRAARRHDRRGQRAGQGQPVLVPHSRPRLRERASDRLLDAISGSIDIEAMSDVLLVDDDQALLGVLARQLLQEGILVRTAGTAADALAQVRRRAPKLVGPRPRASPTARVRCGRGHARRRDAQRDSAPRLHGTRSDSEQCAKLTLGPTRFLTKSKASDEDFRRLVLDSSAAGPTGGTLGVKILIIDDEDDIRSIARSALAKVGRMEVVEAGQRRRGVREP